MCRGGGYAADARLLLVLLCFAVALTTFGYINKIVFCNFSQLTANTNKRNSSISCKFHSKLVDYFYFLTEN